MSYTREEVLAARMKWIEFLCQPERKKARSRLVRKGEHRCCLGHACQALDPERKTGWRNSDTTLRDPLRDRLGMWARDGGSRSVFLRNQDAVTLAACNDETNLTPQEIGAYLRTVVEGGHDTPFMPL